MDSSICYLNFMNPINKSIANTYYNFMSESIPQNICDMIEYKIIYTTICSRLISKNYFDWFNNYNIYKHSNRHMFIKNKINNAINELLFIIFQQCYNEITNNNSSNIFSINKYISSVAIYQKKDYNTFINIYTKLLSILEHPKLNYLYNSKNIAFTIPDPIYITLVHGIILKYFIMTKNVYDYCKIFEKLLHNEIHIF